MLIVPVYRSFLLAQAEKRVLIYILRIRRVLQPAKSSTVYSTAVLLHSAGQKIFSQSPHILFRFYTKHGDKVQNVTSAKKGS